MSDSESAAVKKAVMQQVLQESQVANAKTLITKLQENCFDKCVPKPGAAISSGEQKCLTGCLEKYMSAWNHINATYLARVRREQANGQLN